MIALDASALLAFMFREPGHEEVAKVIDDSCISSVNLAEVLGRFVRDGHKAFEILRHIQATPIEIVEFMSTDAALAASLLPQTQVLGLSLGDRACLAMALGKGIPAITADKLWNQLNIGIEIKLIR